MATSSVAAALAVAEVVAAVDGFTELSPGVPASREALQPLWDMLLQKVEFESSFHAVTTPACSIRLMITGRTSKKAGDLRVFVCGPIEEPSALEERRAFVESKRFPATLGGLADGLAWAKHAAARVRQGEFCERCRVDGGPAPRKRLRAPPWPVCAGCAFEMSLGEPAEKRARSE